MNDTDHRPAMARADMMRRAAVAHGAMMKLDAKKKKEGKLMPIINKPPEMGKRKNELQELIVPAVENYAALIQSAPDHTVNSAPKTVPWKDADFRRWRPEQQAPVEGKTGTTAAKAARP